MKPCPSGQSGVIMNVCSFIPGTNRCEWGMERLFCIYEEVSVSTVSSSSSAPMPTILEEFCICEAGNGFDETRAPGYQSKNCPVGQFGMIMRTCSLLPDSTCVWGIERSYCVT